MRQKREFLHKDLDFVVDSVTKIDAANRRVETEKSGSYDYDWLVVATGADIRPDEVEGMRATWHDGVYDFYSLNGALALRQALKYFSSGRVVLNIAEMPIKCPIAPLEFLFMADWFFSIHGVRDQVELVLVTPLAGFFTKPIATKYLGEIASRKNIKIVPNFSLAAVDGKDKVIESHKGEKVGYDLLVAIPPTFGDKAVGASALGDPMDYLPTDHHTLKAKGLDRVFVIGDATNVPASKAGSVAHYMAHTVVENILREMDGYEAKPSFDGHATCFLASGYDKAVLLDFNYKVEPLPGKFPFPGLGPFTLLKESMANHWGKMMFRWVYWDLMMSGGELPLEPQMNIAGKLFEKMKAMG